jgi:hypothetical protein
MGEHRQGEQHAEPHRHRKKSISKKAPAALEDQSAKTVTTKTFKVHEDQKEIIETALKKAREDGNTTFDTVALYYICQDFLGGQTPAQRLKQMGIEAALAAVEQAFPDAKIEVTLGDGE